MQKKKVIINQNVLEVFVASEFSDWREGLKGESINLSDGLLMIFPSARLVNITMHDMIKPIDVLWLNEKKEIIKVFQSLTPLNSEGNPNRTDGAMCSYVIELQDGCILKYNIKIGDVIHYEK